MGTGSSSMGATMLHRHASTVEQANGSIENVFNEENVFWEGGECVISMAATHLCVITTITMSEVV